MTEPVIERGGAATFGDVTGEYLALRDEAAWVTPWHDVVWVRGPDAVRFLDGLLSQAVDPMEEGAVGRSLLLSPRGKLRATHLLLRGTDEVGLVAGLGVGASVVADLSRFKIRVDAEIVAEAAPVIDVIGPGASAAIESVTGLQPPAQGWVRSEQFVAVAAPFRHSPLPRWVLIGAGESAMAGAGVRRAGRLAADAVRIAAGEALMGVDIDENTIPQEADVVEGAVDFTKGCYLGQELVARIDSRGHVNRRLCGLRVTTNILPPVGAEVVAGERVVGSLTSVAESLDARAPIGLALLRREVDAGDAVQLRWEGGVAPAIVHALPFGSAPR